ncbi:uncharacterized protein LOC100904579 [Galendromus occidentalis]|uniref:Uncharacterized protein LOC100904579 n=1 Tax=Galendromus occidentalis TaxID=34638 RepID=A0AAJ6QXZ8_9ACAR|nr:uncharacterized protein LOC100904579 [Galendromus occidentalis]
MTVFPVRSLCSVRNFNADEREILGWAKYCLCFMDTAILMNFLSATGTFFEATRMYENTPGDRLRFIMTLSLGALYAAMFLSYFMTYCFLKDAITLIRVRLCMLLGSAFANFLFLLIISALVVHFRGSDHLMNQLAIDLEKDTDIAWTSVLFLSAVSVLITLITGVLAIYMSQRLESIIFYLHPFDSYISVTPESPYTRYWKSAREPRSNAMAGDHICHRSPRLYPQSALYSPTKSSMKLSPRSHEFMRELKTNLPSRNEAQRTVL